DDSLEVRRLGSELVQERPDELILVVDAEVPVEAPLEADRRARLLAHPAAAAERAADVAGPQLDAVAELEQPSQRAEEVAGPFLGLDGEIRACDVADEERVAGQDEPRLVGAGA